MSLPHILLGMLTSPGSGYDLKQYFGQSVRHFWYAELSQIYPTLARLEKEGLLSSESVKSDKGPSRKIYTRTKKGTWKLTAWIADGPVCRTERLAYLTQTFFLDAVNMEQRISFMQDLRADFADHLKDLEAVEDNWRANDPGYPDELPDQGFYKQMTLRSGLMKYKIMMDWCDECLERMNKRQ